MKISTKGRYGLRILLELAMHFESTPLSAREISQRQEISDKYLEQIMNILRRSGLVNGTRGSQGGYVLAKSPDQITVGDILRITEGDLSPVSCNTNSCRKIDTCAAGEVWEELKNAIENVVDNITLEQLAERQKMKYGSQYYI